MEQVCPLCNGLRDVRARCAQCDAPLIDEGMVSDFVGPYSPYELTAHVRQGNGGRCTHWLHCSNCGDRSYAIIQSVWI